MVLMYQVWPIEFVADPCAVVVHKPRGGYAITSRCAEFLAEEMQSRSTSPQVLSVGRICADCSLQFNANVLVWL
jgi:hypothetical protein